MRGAEGVVDIDVAELRQRGAERLDRLRVRLRRRAVLVLDLALLLDVETEVLEERDVTILCMHYVEDFTYQEIADTLKITPSRVCQLLWRAVDRLRTQLAADMTQSLPVIRSDKRAA